MTALLLALALAAADTEDVAEERAALQRRLDAEKAAFDALGTEKKSVLTLLETMERLARDSAARATALEKSVARLRAQKAQLERDQAQVLESLAEQRRRIAPRLVAMYRLQKKDALGFLLTSGDFATLLKRRRAVRTLVEADAHELEELALISDYERQQARRLERLDATAQVYLQALRGEQAVGAARRARFQEVVATLGAEQNQSSRVIAELEAQERELASMLTELQSQSSLTGFRALKGHLPRPAKGVVEVGYGKVVNPRFNTVTVQKGVDIRAAAGAPVVSVGDGTVVFSGWLKGYGNLVIVDHGDNYHSLYAHLASSAVEVGDEVEEGGDLGAVGDTGSLKGAYLYFEIRRGGQAVDPMPWLEAEE